NYSMTVVGQNNYFGEITVSWKLTNSAAKIGTTCYATLAEAFGAVKSNDTIILCSDSDEELPILSANNITLDLNGYQIQKKLTTFGSTITLTDSVGGGSVNDGIESKGMLKITNCVVKGEIKNKVGTLYLLDNVEILGIVSCEENYYIMMSGNITFINTTNNIYLYDGARINIIGALTYTKPIGLTCLGDIDRIICYNFDECMEGCDIDDYFFSSQKSYFLKKDEDGIRVYAREIVSQPTSTNFEIGLNYEKGASYAWSQLSGTPITDANVYMPSSSGTFDGDLWHFGNNISLRLYVEGLSRGDYIVINVMEDNFIRDEETETNHTFVYYVTANGENYIVLRAAESVMANSFTAKIQWFKVSSAENVGTDKKLQAVEFEKLYYCVATYDNGYALTSNAVYASHQHNFGYSVDGATLTATCSNNACNLTESKISATLVAGDYVFDGNEHGATIQNVVDFEKVTETTLTIYYEGTGLTTYAKTTNAPTNAGNYKASMTIGDLTAEITFEIKAVSIEEA
ncbi:MAG: hypothetical protein MJ149_03345, partial [Clostridia bacterium]|nr:hypothetical protein [Clostridia bacterium]